MTSRGTMIISIDPGRELGYVLLDELADTRVIRLEPAPGGLWTAVCYRNGLEVHGTRTRAYTLDRVRRIADAAHGRVVVGRKPPRPRLPR